MLVDLLRQNRTIETTTPANPADWLTTLWAGSTTSNTGATVTPTTAMTYGAVFACVRILAESEASLPLITYERLNPGKRRASEHRNYRLLHDAPNPEMTRSEFWEAMIGLMVLWGNSYAEIERDNGFRIKALWPLRPDYMTVKRTNGQLVYEYTVNGTTHYLPPERVLHLRGLGGDGVMGYSPIYLAREAIGLGMATEEYGARFFANDARPGGILTYPGKLNKTQRDNVKDSWEDAHRGLTQSNRIAVLESGFTWQAIGMPNDDAEFLATRKFQITEVARWFRIPPHMLADLEKATFSNIEHQGLEFVTHTLRPWLVRIEQRLNQSLFSLAEQQRYFCEHLVDGLLRGDIASRYQAYATARQNGWMSADDIRELENQNPLPDGQGAIYLVPLNMVPADQAGQVDRSGEGGQAGQAHGAPRTEQRTILTPGDLRANATGNAASRRRISGSYRKMMEEVMTRIVRREGQDVFDRADKLLRNGDTAGLLNYLADFYRGHEDFYIRNTLAVMESLAEQIARDAFLEIQIDAGINDALKAFVGQYAKTAAQGYCGSHEGQLKQLITDAAQGTELAAIKGRLDEWRDKSPGKQVMLHTVRCREAVTREVWSGAGVVGMRWAANGKNCPWCNYLNGKTVTMNAYFAEKDVPIMVEGGVTGAINDSLRPGRDIRHPPLHEGCDCGLEPA